MQAAILDALGLGPEAVALLRLRDQLAERGLVSDRGACARPAPESAYGLTASDWWVILSLAGSRYTAQYSPAGPGVGIAPVK